MKSNSEQVGLIWKETIQEKWAIIQKSGYILTYECALENAMKLRVEMIRKQFLMNKTSDGES